MLRKIIGGISSAVVLIANENFSALRNFFRGVMNFFSKNRLYM
ncbi:MAG: hypothetical protein ACYS1A_02915 [Planctomycetota bacterium]